MKMIKRNVVFGLDFYELANLFVVSWFFKNEQNSKFNSHITICINFLKHRYVDWCMILIKRTNLKYSAFRNAWIYFFLKLIMYTIPIRCGNIQTDAKILTQQHKYAKRKKYTIFFQSGWFMSRSFFPNFIITVQK